MARRILIIEDNRDLCKLFDVYLRAVGYESSYAETCAAGIGKAVTENPDLIITDLNLPDMNGVEATEILKQNPATCDIPIVMLTATSREECKVEALKAGVAAYVVKPVSLPDLVSSIRALTEPPILTSPESDLRDRASTAR
jgi:DNA-binding response OmpR family regulator